MPEKYIILFCLVFALNVNGFCQYEYYLDSGKASFYSYKLHGHRTANGERLNNKNYTAAHRSLPFNTILKVTNLNNDSFVYVRVNDRGPFRHGRIIDLSYNAARRLDMVRHGIVNVKIETVPVYSDTMKFFNDHFQHNPAADSLTSFDSLNLKKDSAFYFITAYDNSDATQMDYLVQFLNNFRYGSFCLVQYFIGTFTFLDIYAGFYPNRKQAESIAILNGDYIIGYFLY